MSFNTLVGLCFFPHFKFSKVSGKCLLKMVFCSVADVLLMRKFPSAFVGLDVPENLWLPLLSGSWSPSVHRLWVSSPMGGSNNGIPLQLATNTHCLLVAEHTFVCCGFLLVAGTQGWRCVGLRFASYREKCCNLHQISCCETHRNKLRKSKLTWAALLNQFSLYPPQVPRFEQKRDLPALSTTPLMWWWKLAILPPSPVALTEARSQLLSGYATISC